MARESFVRRYRDPADRLNEILLPWRALRVSRLLLVGLLFFVGAEWGRYGHTNRWLSGLAFLVIGLALVATAIALGG